MLTTGAPKKWLPTLDGNTYVPGEGGILAAWPGEEGYQINYPYYYTAQRDAVTEVIRTILGDENGIALEN